jgi:hypothetical protein
MTNLRNCKWEKIIHLIKKNNVIVRKFLELCCPVSNILLTCMSPLMLPPLEFQDMMEFIQLLRN